MMLVYILLREYFNANDIASKACASEHTQGSQLSLHCTWSTQLLCPGRPTLTLHTEVTGAARGRYTYTPQPFTTKLSNYYYTVIFLFLAKDPEEK